MTPVWAQAPLWAQVGGSAWMRATARKAYQLVSNARLHMPASLRLAIQARMVLEGQQTRNMPSRDRAARALESGIQAVPALAKETRAAPTDFLRRTNAVQRGSVLTQFIRGLSAAESTLDHQVFEACVANAYCVLQALRAADWDELVDQRLLGEDSEVGPRTSQLLQLHHKLMEAHSERHSGGEPNGRYSLLREELGLLYPEFTSRKGLDDVQLALQRVPTELDEAMRREAEARSMTVEGRPEWHPGDAVPVIPKQAVVVEYEL